VLRKCFRYQKIQKKNTEKSAKFLIEKSEKIQKIRKKRIDADHFYDFCGFGSVLIRKSTKNAEK
jgi:hypothetical protein